MINVTVQRFKKTATLKIEGTADRKHTKGIKNANLVLLDSADHFVVNGDEVGKADISYYQLIVAVYLTMQREKTDPLSRSDINVESEALKIILNAARLKDAFKVKVSKN
jgi:hypothetical protein